MCCEKDMSKMGTNLLLLMVLWLVADLMVVMTADSKVEPMVEMRVDSKALD